MRGLSPTKFSPALKRQASRFSGFEGQQGLHTGEQEGHRNRDSASKGRTQKLTCSETQHRGNNLMEHTSDTCWLWRASKRGRKQAGFPLGIRQLEVATLGSSFYHADTDAGKHYFGVLPLALKGEDLAPPTTQLPPVLGASWLSRQSVT